MPDAPQEADSQDVAEIFDEENITEDGRDIADADMAPDLFDVTRAEDDGLDESLVGSGDLESFDPDAADEAELEMMSEADDGIDQPNAPGFDGEEIVTTDAPSSADFESRTLSDEDIAELGYRLDVRHGVSRSEDQRLDEGVEETFPASDPVSISPGSD